MSIGSAKQFPRLCRPRYTVPIRSTQDSLKKLFEKGQYYLSWGVLNFWIIDPEAQTAWAMTPENPNGIWIHPDGSLMAGQDTVIALPDLFAEVDKLVSR